MKIVWRVDPQETGRFGLSILVHLRESNLPFELKVYVCIRVPDSSNQFRFALLTKRAKSITEAKAMVQAFFF